MKRLVSTMKRLEFLISCKWSTSVLNKSLTITRILIFLILCLTVACGKSDNSTPPPKYQIVQSTLARDTNPQVPDADFTAVVAGNTDFALKVFPLIDPSGSNNTVFSPYSITQAFALTAPGARGNTLSGIEQALSFTLPQDRLNKAFNKLDLLIMSEANGSITSTGYQLPILRNANAIWGQKGFSILPTYLDTLAINYGAGLHVVDFINEIEDARTTINSWVEDQTNNRIQNLIPPGGVGQSTRLVLTNAVWFKAYWETRFPNLYTRNQTFFNHDGTSSSVPFMQNTLAVPYAQVDNSQAVDLPYVGNNFSMLVIMPDPGTFDTFMTALTPTVLSEIIDNLAPEEMLLNLPKFTFTYNSDMVPILKSFGMTDAFNLSAADFSGIDGSRDLVVADVFHQAFISVYEQGTEAAAATGVVFATGPPPSLVLVIDHPYIFIIREKQTGLILFMGKVLSP
jgi:serine protease inhibitor